MEERNILEDEYPMEGASHQCGPDVVSVKCRVFLSIIYLDTESATTSITLYSCMIAGCRKHTFSLTFYSLMLKVLHVFSHYIGGCRKCYIVLGSYS